MPEKMSQIGTLTIAVGFLLLTFQNCGSSDEAELRSAGGGSASTETQIQKRYDELRDLSANDLNCASVADCEAIPLGAKACGGPADYLVASVKNAHYEEILDLAEELAEIQSKYLVDNQVIGTCDYRMPPDLECAASKCQAK